MARQKQVEFYTRTLRNGLSCVAADTWNTLGHESESNPSADLVCIIGTRYSVEEQREGVHSGSWDFTFLRTGRSQVT